MATYPRLEANTRQAMCVWLDKVESFTGKKISAVARLAGLNPATLTKFMNNPKHKSLLSRATIDSIYRLLETYSVDKPGDSVDTSNGLGQPTYESLRTKLRGGNRSSPQLVPFIKFLRPVGVKVLGRLEGNVRALTRSLDWTKERHYTLPMMLRRVKSTAKVRAYEVFGTFADRAYPHGSVVSFLPVSERAPQHGDHVIVRHALDRRRVTGDIREVVTGGEGRLWLASLSSDPALQAPLAYPPERAHHHRVIGVVVGSFRPAPNFE